MAELWYRVTPGRVNHNLSWIFATQGPPAWLLAGRARSNGHVSAPCVFLSRTEPIPLPPPPFTVRGRCDLCEAVLTGGASTAVSRRSPRGPVEAPVEPIIPDCHGGDGEQVRDVAIQVREVVEQVQEDDIEHQANATDRVEA